MSSCLPKQPTHDRDYGTKAVSKSHEIGLTAAVLVDREGECQVFVWKPRPGCACQKVRGRGKSASVCTLAGLLSNSKGLVFKYFGHRSSCDDN